MPPPREPAAEVFIVRSEELSKLVILSGARSAESKNLGRAVNQTLDVLSCCAAKILRQAQDDKSLLRSNYLSTPDS